jgi:hypothetical protein
MEHRLLTARFASIPVPVWLAVIGIALLVWAALLPFAYKANNWIYSWDSVAYFETADSIHAGRGMMQRVIDGIDPAIWQPISWWPPGYPILIALVQALGFTAMQAGLIVAVAAAAGSVVLIGLICLHLCPWPQALLVTLATIAMPTFLQISTQAMSDSVYYLFVVGSVLGILKWTSARDAPWAWMFLAGLFAGAAWSMRYAGMALFAATGVLFLLLLLQHRFIEVVKFAATWLLGVAVCGLPLLLRNILVFGTGNPYSMRPSELTLWENVRRAARVLVEDITTSALLANLVANAAMLSLLAAALLAALGYIVWHLSWARIASLLQTQKFFVFLGAYTLFYVAIVIAARTRYRWGQEIDSRHLVQVYWIIWISVAAGLTAVLVHYRFAPNVVRNSVYAVLLAAMALQMGQDAKRIAAGPAPRWDRVQSGVGPDAASFLKQEVGNRQIVLSTRAELLRLYSDVNARKLPNQSQSAFLAPVSLDDIHRIGRAGLLWGIVIEDIEGAKRGEYDTVARQLVEDPQRYPELRKVDVAGPALIFKYVVR